jgi:NADH-quinone oxidoreductase subunit J
MNLSGEFVAFFILSVMAIGGAVFMINLTRVVHMALALAFVFFSIAGLYLLLGAGFLAVIQVLIYAGAVTILMLFGIMLTKHRDDDKPSVAPWHAAISFAGVALFLAAVLWILYKNPLPSGQATGGFGVRDLGVLVFKQYMLPFEMTSVLLLVALVGAVILARREDKE